MTPDTPSETNRAVRRLEKARDIANRDTELRLKGQLGEEAHEAIWDLLHDAGMTAAESDRILSAVFWQGWCEGWEAGHARTGTGDPE